MLFDLELCFRVFSSDDEAEHDDLFELVHIGEDDDVFLLDDVLGDVLASLDEDDEGVVPPSIDMLLLLFVFVVCNSICSSWFEFVCVILLLLPLLLISILFVDSLELLLFKL